MGSIRVAIVGVGNCASSLVQGVEYYKDASPEGAMPGLMHVTFGEYHVRDVEFVAAFDVDDKKVGKDLAEAINSIREQHHPDRGGADDRRHRAARPHPRRARQVLPDDDRRVPAEPVDVVATLREARVDVLVSYLPVGSEEADKFYASCAIEAGVAFVNALPVFIASDPEWAARFEGGRGADHRRHQVAGGRRSRTGCWRTCSRSAASCSTGRTSSTSAATWTSRTCSSVTGWSRRRSPRPRQ